MATNTPKPAPPKSTSDTGNEGQAPDDPQATPPAADPKPTAPDPKRRRAELRAALAALGDDDDGQGEPEPDPTHVLVLANGERVDIYGALPTHYATKSGVFAVVACHSLTGV
jgi:hypothetical protein